MEQNQNRPPDTPPEQETQNAPPGWQQGQPPPAPQWAPRVNAAFDPRAKSPVLASVLSLFPGLGQIYVGYYQRGFIHGGVFAGLIALMAAMSEREFTPLAPMTGVFMAFFYLYNVIDAGRRAAMYNQALAGGADIPLPQDGLPGTQGSLFGGAILVVVGFLLLGHTRFGFSIDWIEEWWPILPVIVGFYLIYKNFENRLSERSSGQS